MGAFIDLTGKRFGRWVVIERRGIDKRGKPAWYCECDCGKKRLVGGMGLRDGTSKSCGCYNMELRRKRSMEDHPYWKGGRYISEGYCFLRARGHPHAQQNGYVMEHVFIMSEHIGRPLKKKEIVHHKNGIKDDNRIENLELWAKSHPPGQRVKDLVSFAVEILEEYAPDKLKDQETMRWDGCDSVLYGPI
jgi:hypothetical protein